MTTLTVLILIGGAMHFGILIASALVPGVLDWRSELKRLAPITRHLVWVHGAFIVITIVGLGILAIVNAPALAAGGILERSICAFIAVFWGVRLSLQFFLFDPKPYLTRKLLKLGYHGLTVVFAYLSIVFAYAALT